MDAGRRLAQALAIARRYLSSSHLRIQEERSFRDLPRVFSTALNLKLEQTHSVLDTTHLVSDLLLAGEAGKSTFLSNLICTSRIVSASPWAWTAFARGYHSTSESRTQDIKGPDEEGKSDGSNSEHDDEEDEDVDEHDSESGIEWTEEDEAYTSDEEGQEERYQEPVKKKTLFLQNKPKAIVEKGPILNENISATTVRLVGNEFNGHRIVTREEALFFAKKKQMDLVQVDHRADPPVCKIFDFNREQYKREQVLKERKKEKGPALKLNETKELRFSAKTEPKDLKMKVEKAKQFLERGYRVKFVVNFKGNVEDEGNRQEQGKIINTMLPMIEDVAIVEQGPRVESRLAWVLLRHMKFGKGKKKSMKPAKQNDSTRGANDAKEAA